MKRYLLLLLLETTLASCWSWEPKELAIGPIADFSSSGGDCTIPCDVVFTNKSMNATSYQWSFGDGVGTSTLANPRYTYTKEGSFEVKLTATGPGGINSKTDIVTIKSTTQSPPFSIIWDKTFGASSNEDLFTMLANSDGSFILGGQSASNLSGDKSQNSKGEYDYWVVKIGADGSKIWDKSFGSNGNDYWTSMVATGDGDYLLVGQSSSDISGDKSDNSKGKADYWIVKIDANGNKLWDRTFGGSEDDLIGEVVCTVDGGFLLGGSSGSGVSGDKTSGSRGVTDYWVVRIDKNGNKLWDKTFGGESYESLKAMVVTSDGFLLGGNSYSNASGDKSDNSRGANDYWLLKIDTDGNKIWNKTFGGSNDEDLSSMLVTSDGFLVGGLSSSPQSGDKTSQAGQNKDFWLLSIKSSGEKTWDKAYGGDDDDRLESITTATGGGYIIGGASKSNASGNKGENSRGALDYWIIKIKVDGTKELDRTYGGRLDDDFHTHIQTNDGNYLLGGRSESNISGEKSASSRGAGDYWVIKVKP